MDGIRKRRSKRQYIHIYLFRGFNDARAQYLKINQVSLQLIEISKVWPFMHGILSFHEYMHPRYIYIYINIFPREENTSDGIRIPPPNNLPPRNRYSKIIFIIREFLLRCETPIASEKKKNVLLLGKKCPFSSQCVVVALNRKRVKKKKEEEEKWKG